MGAAEDEPSEGPPSSEEVPRVPRPWDFLSDGAPTGGPPGGPPGGPSLCSLPSCLSEGVGSNMALDFFSCLCRSQSVSDEELMHSQLFACLAPWILRVHATPIGAAERSRVREEAFFRLMHFGFIDKGESLQQEAYHHTHERLQEQQQGQPRDATAPANAIPRLPSRPSPALEEDPSGCPPHPFFSAAQLMDAAAVEAVRLLYLLAPASRDIQQQAFVAIKRNRVLTEVLCNNGLTPQDLMRAPYFPSIFMLAAFHPRSVGSLLRFLVPSIAAGGSFGEVCNALLDLPLTAAFLEKWGPQGPPGNFCCPLLLAASKYLLRTETHKAPVMWEGRSEEELQRLMRLCEGLPASPRVSAVCKAVPLCLDILFKEALQAPHPQPRAELFRALLQRFSLLYPLSFFVDDFKSRAVEATANILLLNPALLLQQRHQIVQGIRAHSNPQGAPLAEALCWAVGALLTPELIEEVQQQQEQQGLCARPSEVVAEYFEALEAVAYEALAPMAPPERPTLIFESHRPPGEPLHTGFLSGGRTTLFSDATSAEGLDSHSSPKEATAALETPRAARRTGASRAALGDDRRPASIDIDLSDWASSEGLAAKGPPATPRAAQVASLDLPPSLICVSVAALSQLKQGQEAAKWVSRKIGILIHPSVCSSSLSPVETSHRSLSEFGKLWKMLQQSEQALLEDGTLVQRPHSALGDGSSSGHVVNGGLLTEADVFARGPGFPSAVTSLPTVATRGDLVAKGLLQRLRSCSRTTGGSHAHEDSGGFVPTPGCP
ncbi:hypothetical protein cyc_02013 [Cyclospora cayetanensis]|uniref:AP-5 complex subunit zeta-1 C-terminal TPR domain-containing protein n=1 Tax=Cyclospora cayetanensis TaxID=88456 RepID=A0A1D3CW96_9EIME|nr:hypothetical protein cyc_02013 [Cyclospora cayetanensis]